MVESDDIKFMRRCLDLASKAEGFTYPNPLVGSVIVHEGKIIGEGYHIKAGEPHAEVNAINSVRDKSQLKASTLYVNLEPCSHHGKTPPCSDLIISYKIPKVVIGTPDTSLKVSGRGMRKLEDAGVQILCGVLEKECRYINRRFFTFNEKKRPYITLKWAQSSDGLLDIHRYDSDIPEPTWITGKAERILVHRWRASEEAILVGAGTVNSDNPLLNVREWTGIDPLKIILSGSGTVNRERDVFNHGTNVVVFTNIIEGGQIKNKEVKLVPGIPASVQITDYLYQNGIQSLFIEGGAKVLNHFIETGMWDEARVFTGKSAFKDGVKAPLMKDNALSRTVFNGSILEQYFKVIDEYGRKVDI